AYMTGDPIRNAPARSNGLMRTPELLTFTLAYLGSAVDEPMMQLTKTVGLDWQPYRLLLSVLAGALGVAWLLFWIGTAVSEPHGPPGARVALLHILVFLALSGAMTAYGRVQFPMIDVLTSRYNTPSLLFWAGLFGVALSA